MRPARGLLVAAPRSGSGKTTVTLGLQRALVRRGLRIRGVKCGPDYIDPAFHAAATGAPCLNLDSVAMPDEVLAALAAEGAVRSPAIVAIGAIAAFRRSIESHLLAYGTLSSGFGAEAAE